MIAKEIGAWIRLLNSSDRKERISAYEKIYTYY